MRAPYYLFLIFIFAIIRVLSYIRLQIYILSQSFPNETTIILDENRSFPKLFLNSL